ncbi:MAG: hypothetical protein R2862_04695 [Thermoanaerobaculia bacterium]
MTREIRNVGAQALRAQCLADRARGDPPEPQAQAAAGDELFPGILGYERTVVLAITNALLAGHDFILLGLRGQAKSRLLRQLTSLLDAEVPVLAGSEINDDPPAPVSTWATRLRRGRRRRALADRWSAESRYNEKLATPDVSIADPLGISTSTGRHARLTYADPEVADRSAHPPRHLRHQRAPRPRAADPGRPAQPAGRARSPDSRFSGTASARHPVRLLGEPRDYTNRGSIITGKDRIASQILTTIAEAAIAALVVSAGGMARSRRRRSDPDAVRLLIEKFRSPPATATWST